MQRCLEGSPVRGFTGSWTACHAVSRRPGCGRLGVGDRLVRKLFSRRRKLAQLVANHFGRDVDRDVVFAIVDEELEPEAASVESVGRSDRYGRADTDPTKLGRMVHALAVVLMAVLVCMASARLGKAVKKGPARVRGQPIGSEEGIGGCAPFQTERLSSIAVACMLPAAPARRLTSAMAAREEVEDCAASGVRSTGSSLLCTGRCSTV